MVQVGVGIFVIRDGKILLGKRKKNPGKGTWQLPGGKMEFSESPEQCAIRELKEETSLIGKNPKPLTWVNSFFENDGIHFISLLMIITDFEGTPTNIEPEACEGWEWFTLGSLPEPLFLSLELFKRDYIFSEQTLLDPKNMNGHNKKQSVAVV